MRSNECDVDVLLSNQDELVNSISYLCKKSTTSSQSNKCFEFISLFSLILGRDGEGEFFKSLEKPLVNIIDNGSDLEIRSQALFCYSFLSSICTIENWITSWNYIEDIVCIEYDIVI
jgi:hypothetical protein